MGKKVYLFFIFIFSNISKNIFILIEPYLLNHHSYYVIIKFIYCVYNCILFTYNNNFEVGFSLPNYCFSFTHPIILFLPILNIPSSFSMQIHFLPVRIAATPVVMLPAVESSTISPSLV